MAEEGKAKEQEQTADEAFTEELTKNVTPEKEKEPEKKPEPEPKPEGSPEKAPEKAQEPVHGKEKENAAPAISEEDKALLTAYDFTEADANPKLLAALKKAEGDKHALAGQVTAVKTERDRWGAENKTLSEKLKAFAKEQGTSLPLVMEKIKARLSKIPKDKLSEHAQKLLEDPAYLEAQAALEVARMIEEPPVAEEHHEEKPADQPDKAKLQEQAVKLFDEVKKIHPDITDIYSKPEFYTWAKTQDPAVQALYFKYDAAAHVDLANRYKAYVKATKAAEAINKDDGADAFASHGATGAQRKGPEKDLSPEDAFEDELAKHLVKK